uniref:ABC transporter domain-containing protein n=2 Tax=Acrobeloides nanus TaxID=290746 RepID=A0A914E5T5_9BILA
MEEVFLKVNKLADEKQPSENNNMENDEQDRLVQNNSVERFRPTRKLQGSSLYLSQAKAMFTKRYLFFRRRPGSIYGQVIAPLIYFALLTYTSTKIKSSTDQNSLPINLSVYASDGVSANIFVEWTQGNFTSSVRQGISEVNQGVSFVLTETNDTLNVIVEDTKNDGLTKFSKHNPLGFAWNGSFVLESKPFTIINALFNNFALHSPSLAVNLADMIMFTNSTNNFNIYVTNHPLPPSNSDKLQNTNNLNNAQFWSTSTIGFGIIVAMSLVISGFTYFLIREKKNKAKHLQIMSGVQIWFYWLTTALWDCIFFVGAIIAFTIIMNVFHIKEYTSRTDTLILVVFMMLLYGWPGLPFAYTLSFPFTNPSRAYTLVMLSSTFTAILGTIIIPLISISSKSWGDVIEIIWSLLFPTYTLSSAFNKIYNNENSRSVCASIDCNNTLIAANNRGCCGTGDRVYTDNILGTFGSKGVLLNVIILILQGFFFWFTTIALEKGWLNKIKLTKPNSEQIETDTITIEDEDVSREREIVHTLNENETPIVAKDLKKWYNDFYAVKGLSFHVNNGDCFGLLGVNGAGKTSTFQMLTGENVIDKGNAYIQGFDVTTQWRESGRLIGYCPQYDAFIKELTGEEMLYMFARIRGIFEEDIPDVVFSIIESLGLTQYAKKQIKNYSGGNKRRLSLGIALVGLPEVLLLDEPTTGVDPKARRIIWNVLSKVRESGHAFVLTSHNMEECEALCTNIAIMVDGRFKCIGSQQHIKSKYGAGYSLLIRVEAMEYIEKAKRWVQELFLGSELKEQHLLQLKFELKRNDETTWSLLFSEMESISSELHIVDYSLSQTTLEQVFLEFSKGTGN